MNIWQRIAGACLVAWALLIWSQPHQGATDAQGIYHPEMTRQIGATLDGIAVALGFIVLLGPRRPSSSP
jgi:hypothetical protein